ncbi:MAG TPA: hypothetical protein VG650_10490 [Mycobacteriales bacterium]|nr:hypothetical protein [Mycobacteriales bacterium]
MSDDDDRQHAAEAAWADLVVPDDLRALSRDVATYRREVRRADRSRRLRRLLARRGVVPALAIGVATLLAGMVAVLLAVMGPRTVGRAPAAVPLAAPTQAPGTLGGLLPAASLRAQDGSSISTRSAALRPEVFALVPVDCGCGALLNALAGQAGSEQLRLGIVVPAATDPSTSTILNGLDRGRPSVYFDPQATLATAVSATGVTTVVVNVDGTIYDIESNITDPTKTSLDAALQSMLLSDRR